MSNSQNVKISDLPSIDQIDANGNDMVEVSSPQPDGAEHPYNSKKISFSRLGNWIGTILNFDSLQTDNKTIIGAINELNTGGSFWDSVPDGPGPHNSFFRGIDLGDPANIDWYTVAQDKFHNMFVGDYWKTYDQVTDQWITWRIAGFDYYRGIGYPGTSSPHITVIPDTVIIPAPTQIFTSPGYSAVGGYYFSNAKGYKVISETHQSSEGYIEYQKFNPNAGQYVIDLDHPIISSYYFLIDGVFTMPSSSGWNSRSLGDKNQITYGSRAQEPPVTPPSFSEIKIIYLYYNDSDLQTYEETFTNADVRTIGEPPDSSYGNGYVLLSRPASSISEVLVNGQNYKYYQRQLNGFMVQSLSNTNKFTDAQTIKVTYRSGNNYGVLNQARQIINRTLNLNNHLMQTNKIISGGNLDSYNNIYSLRYSRYYTCSDIEIPTEQQITGNRTIGVEDNWTKTIYSSIGNTESNSESSQLPLFSLRPDMRCIGTGYWLRDRCYATPLSNPLNQAELDAVDTLFLGVNATGEVTAESGSGGLSNFGIRPVFNLGYTVNPFIPPITDS